VAPGNARIEVAPRDVIACDQAGVFELPQVVERRRRADGEVAIALLLPVDRAGEAVADAAGGEVQGRNGAELVALALGKEGRGAAGIVEAAGVGEIPGEPGLEQAFQAGRLELDVAMDAIGVCTYAGPPTRELSEQNILDLYIALTSDQLSFDEFIF
jgi:hypothetical protein